MPIHVLEGDSTLLTFEGCGFDERDSVPFHLNDGHPTVPCTQKLPLPGQVKPKLQQNEMQLYKYVQHCSLCETALCCMLSFKTFITPMLINCLLVFVALFLSAILCRTKDRFLPLLCLQVVFLSEETVSFGDIPVCSRSTHILFLSNVSHTDKILYSWKLKEQKLKQVCTFIFTDYFKSYKLQFVVISLLCPLIIISIEVLL